MNIDKNVCEKDVFDDIFRIQSNDLHDFLYYKFGADNSPEDLVQEAFMKLWENCKDVLPEKARSYLFTVANNLMLNTLSRKKTVLNYQQQKPVYNIETPQYLMEESEYMNKLQNALEELTEDQRVTFLLNRIEGKKHMEIAEMLGISKKAVEKRIYTTLIILRKKIGDI